MIQPPIALGMYTVFQNAQRDFENTIHQVAQMGYQGIEMYGEPADFPASRVSGALRDEGLALVGWHIEWRHLQEAALEETVGFCKEAGLTCVIIPCLGGKWAVAHTPDQECEALWDAYLERMESIRARLAREGIRLGYHNHEHEFQIRYGGRTLFDKLYGALNEKVIMELDSGNAIEGGADPVRVLKQRKGRRVFLHCKPYSHTDAFDVAVGETGDANDWPAMVKAADDTCEWLIIESESSRLSEMENARVCIKGLKASLQCRSEE